MLVNWSLAYQKQKGYTLTLFCEAQPNPGDNPCRHTSQADWDTLIESFGPDFVIPDAYDYFRSKLRCGKCGGRSIGLILSPPAVSLAGGVS